jgi:DNA-binding SARP family transcriptional activator
MSATIISTLLSCSELAEGPAVVLLGGPYVILDGTRLEIPEGSKRLLVFTALNARQVDRRHVAGCLWPTGSDQRAAGNLRSALWRLKCAGINLIESDNCSLKLRPGTAVDVHVVSNWAARLIGGSAAQSDLCSVYWPPDATDLLPGWYDDWMIFERERIRQRLLHALEALSQNLIKLGRCAEAVDAAISAVGADPLRESASRTLIEAHLAEGNWIEGRRTYERYRDIVRRELGIEPSRDLADLVRTAPSAYRGPCKGVVAEDAGQFAGAGGQAYQRPLKSIACGCR